MIVIKVELFLNLKYYLYMILFFLFFIPLMAFPEDINIKPPVFLDDYPEYRSNYIINTHILLKESFKETTLTNVKIELFIYKIDNKIHLKAKINSNETNYFDEVYVKSPISEEIWIKTLETLNIRLKKILSGEMIEFYVAEDDIRLKEKINSFSDEELISLINDLNRISSLQMFNVFSFGFSYPSNLEVNFITFFKTWKFNDFLSIGFGGKVLKVYPFLPYETNSVSTLLPVEICFPLIINQKSKANDLILSFEWGWYKNNTSSNTNISYQGEINYVDLNFKYILPYTLLKAGLNYNYLKDKWLFYFGVETYLGSYTKD